MSFLLCVEYDGIKYYLQRKNIFSSNLNYARIYKSERVAELARNRLWGEIFLQHGNTLNYDYNSILIRGKSLVTIIPLPKVDGFEVDSCGVIGSGCNIDCNRNPGVNSYCPVFNKYGWYE